MQNDKTIITISNDNTNILEQFLLTARKSLITFRYYDKRDFTAIKNHVCTYILLDDEIPVGYGHLDKDDNIIWLGIAISESAQGKGYGKMMLKKLIDTALELKIENINLSVDTNNETAISLYEKHGFQLQKTINNTHFFQKKIS